MIFSIYGKALAVLAKKPFRLWGISLLSVLFTCLGYVLGGPVVAIGLAVQYLITGSMANIYLKGYRGEEDIHVVDIFSTFKDWKTVKRVACSLAWADLWVLLWSLIPFVGFIFAIIRTYEYAFVPYIIMERQEVGITEAKDESKKLTNGYKSKMFWAEILFVVIVIVAAVILVLLARIPYIGFIFGIALFLFILCVLAFGTLFLNLVRAAFYEEAQGAGKAITADAAPQTPAEPQA